MVILYAFGGAIVIFIIIKLVGYLILLYYKLKGEVLKDMLKTEQNKNSILKQDFESKEKKLISITNRGGHKK